AVPPHIGEIGIPQDHERPCAHRRARFEPVLGGPGFEQCFLHEVVGHVRPAAKTAGKGAQMGNDLGQLALEGALLLGGPLGPCLLRGVAHVLPSSSLASNSWNVSGNGSSTTES